MTAKKYFEESHKLFVTLNPELKKKIGFEKKFEELILIKKAVFEFIIASYRVILH
jgi:hypothetical protein